MVQKALLPALASLVTALLTAIGGVIYQHEKDLRELHRDIEALRVKDYRQHVAVLRWQIDRLTTATGELGGVLEDDPTVLGPSGKLLLRLREGELRLAEERLENYVEENKHYGED